MHRAVRLRLPGACEGRAGAVDSLRQQFDLFLFRFVGMECDLLRSGAVLYDKYSRQVSRIGVAA